MKPAFHTAPAELSPREVTRVRISLCHSVPATDLRAPTFPFLVELGDGGAAGKDDVLVGDTGDDVGAGVAWVGLEDSGDAAEIHRHGELPGVERVVGKGQNGAVGKRPNSSGGVDVGLSALAFCLVLGALNALLEGRKGFVAVHALKRGVAFDDAGRDAGMGPDGNALRAVEGVAERMIKVIVRVEGGA